MLSAIQLVTILHTTDGRKRLLLAILLCTIADTATARQLWTQEADTGKADGCN